MSPRSMVAFLVVISFAVSGCIFSPPKDDNPPPPPPPLNTCAATPDALMDLFETIYSTRNFEAYSEILSEDFLFVTDDRTDTYGYDEEIDITYKMFTGLAGTDGIVFRNITVDQLDPLYIWQPTDPNDEFFGGSQGSQYRDYQVDINFYVAGENLRFRVQGLVRYYVMQETVDGEICYRYLGMEDYTQGK
jgi:hypothetical protein